MPCRIQRNFSTKLSSILILGHPSATLCHRPKKKFFLFIGNWELGAPFVFSDQHCECKTCPASQGEDLLRRRTMGLSIPVAISKNNHRMCAIIKRQVETCSGLGGTYPACTGPSTSRCCLCSLDRAWGEVYARWWRLNRIHNFVLSTPVYLAPQICIQGQPRDFVSREDAKGALISASSSSRIDLFAIIIAVAWGSVSFTVIVTVRVG